MRTCQSPTHHGDRRIRHPFDAWERRTTYRRSDGKVRRHEKTIEIVCTVCIEANGVPHRWEGPSEQGALLI